MTTTLIERDVDIYTYPDEFEDSLGCSTIGDLHGNSVKALHFLFRQQIIKFKPTIEDKATRYEQFVDAYEFFGVILDDSLDSLILLIKERNKRNSIIQFINELEEQAIAEPDSFTSIKICQQNELVNLKKSELAIAELKFKLHQPIENIRLCIRQFNDFMLDLDISDLEALIRFIGDEVADRGNCDYFTLRILDFLYQNKVQNRILASNHGFEFIHAYEEWLGDTHLVPPGRIAPEQSTSIFGLLLLLETKVIEPTEVRNIINNCYKASLKLIDYSLDDLGITLFSHAPVRFDTIKLLADLFHLPYEDETKELLAHTIDSINTHFKTFADNNSIHTLFDNNKIKDPAEMTEEERKKYPVVYLIWNRWSMDKEDENARPCLYKGYNVTYVHGHDPYQSPYTHIHNLDTFCGKEARNEEEIQFDAALAFIDKHKNTDVDVSSQEHYLESVFRYKVLDSDEHRYKPMKKSIEDSSAKSPGSLSLFAHPVAEQQVNREHTSKDLITFN